MADKYTHFGEYKLVTEFLSGGRYKHTYPDGVSGPTTRTWVRKKTLGQGAYGAVYMEICTDTRGERAVKEVAKNMARPSELAILTTLRSYPDHFVQLEGWFDDDFKIYIVMEYLACGDLHQLIVGNGVSEHEAKMVTSQIVEGLKIMHKQNLCHRDLKPRNVLVVQWAPIKVKIADFGVTKDFEGTSGHTTTGTQPFTAPEVWGLGNEGGSYTIAVDIWSLGCLVYFMMTKSTPFPEFRDLIAFYHNGANGPEHPCSDLRAKALSVSARRFITRLLRPLGQDRPSAEETLRDPWLEKEPETSWGTSTTIREVIVPPVISNPRIQQALNIGLHAAAGKGDCQMIIKLLEKGAQIDAEADRRTVMYRAAKGGHIDAVKLLLKSGGDVEIGGSEGFCALHGAVCGGKLEMVIFLLGMGVDISKRCISGHTALHLTAEYGGPEVARLLLDRGANISDKANNGATALHITAQYGQLEVAKLLLERGAKASDKMDTGRTPLHIAAEHGQLEVAKLVLDQGVNISDKLQMGHTALHIAAEFGQLEVAKLLLDRGANDNISDKGKRGSTALHVSAEYGQLEVAKLLLDRGARTSDRMDMGRTALHVAAEAGQVEMVKLLLDRGAKISDKINSGHTALHLAAEFGQLEVVRLLLDRGANVSSITRRGCTPLHITAEFGQLEVAELLLDRGAETSDKMDIGFTALHVAAQQGRMEVARLLLTRGGDLHALCADGSTAMDVAVKYGHNELALMLLEVFETAV